MRALPAVFIATIAFATGTLIAAGADDAVSMSQHVIEQQIQAFLSDDADAAYSFAAPAIKAKFPDKSLFFAMVKKSYGPVYHPGNYAFGRSKSVDNGATLIQELMISGRDGKNWRAIYKMTRQPDNSYKIEGVAIVPDTVSKAI